MAEAERYVVGVDWTDGAQHALEWTAALARRTGAAVEMVHAGSPWVGLEMAVPPFDYDQYRKAVGQSVEEWAEKLNGIAHHTTVIEDEAAHVILSQASQLDAAMIVVGSHGAGRWAPNLLGSVTTKLLHWAERPVAVVPLAGRPNPEEGRIVVGVDGSGSSLRALRWAAAWARDLEVGVYAACVFPSNPYHEKPRLADPDSPEPEAETLRALRDLVAQVARESQAEIASDVFLGDPADRLVDVAEGEFSLVVGSKGHSQLRSMVLGSTSRACATHSRVPTLVVP